MRDPLGNAVRLETAMQITRQLMEGAGPANRDYAIGNARVLALGLLAWWGWQAIAV
jgi:hypothetical protein